MKKKYPESPTCLLPGDTIAVIAPASPFNPDQFNRGLTVLESMGFEIEIPPGIFSSKGYLAGDDLHRSELLNNAFKSTEIKAIICARGGFGSIRILDRLDYDAIGKNPKIFVGFSDISSLLTAIYERCGVVTFHGPTVTSLADADKETVSALFSILTSEKVLSIYDPYAISIKPGLAKGPVMGGNLTTLCHLVGTPFEPEFSGHILFLEDRGEAPYRIDRMLTQMKMAGCFEGLSGMILGSFSECGDLPDVIQVFKDCFAGFDIPILAGIKAGHEKTNIALPIGLEATLNSDEKYLCYHTPSAIKNSGKAICSITSEQYQAKHKKKRLSGQSTYFYEIDSLMAEATRKFVFPGAVLLFSKNEEVLFHKAYGIGNIIKNFPVALNTVFDLASLTKPLATTTSIMALVRDGKLTLEDQLGQILPEFKNSDKNEIRIEHLLSHTSGLPDYLPYFRILEKYPLHERKSQLRQLLLDTHLKNSIGHTTLYSDLGFMILSWIIERTAGVRIDRFVTDEVFSPIGLTNLFYQDFYEEKKMVDFAATEICPWRKTLIEGVVHDENAYAVGGIEGHAGLFGTAEDIHRLLKHMLLIHNESLSIGLFPTHVVKTFLQRWNSFDRSLGFDTPSDKNSSAGHFFSRDSVGHLGFTGTSFWIDLQRSIIVILLTNRIHPDRNNEKLKKFRPVLHDTIMGNILKS
jgi:muramoyltetrapeptide carboxypeptidase LdcA involved in peptidoglycan recycling/CubicO group peptidase (beta-lactamase class C family)